MSAALRSPPSPVIGQTHKFVPDQIGEYDFSQFQKLTQLNQRKLEDFGKELPCLNAKKDVQHSNLAIIV